MMRIFIFLMVLFFLSLNLSAFEDTIDDDLYDDDAFSWGYCTPECNREISRINHNNGTCYVVYECNVREYDSETDSCIVTDETELFTKREACPVIFYPPYPPHPYNGPFSNR